jgi:hypothetical protein
MLLGSVRLVARVRCRVPDGRPAEVVQRQQRLAESDRMAKLPRVQPEPAMPTRSSAASIEPGSELVSTRSSSA